jgi:orotidine 5'-phosphate decarboxylase subfamily 1
MRNIDARERLIAALDVPSAAEARALAERLGDAVHFYKIGLELFTAGGYFELLEWLRGRGHRVFADLKLYDIPETVRRAVANLRASGASFLTVHAERSILEAAAREKGDLKILAVTVLTSFDQRGLAEMGYAGSVEDLVLARARAAFESGCDGVIASGRAIRNIAIIAHVDHGKTTLVDKLLRQSGTFAAHQQLEERVMDSNDLEKERGITILAKNCAIQYEGTHINIVDTPGHADFGGEVERVLSMVDGVLLLVDAVEGPDAADALRHAQGAGPGPEAHRRDQQGRPAGRAPDWVVGQTFDLFDKLGATEEQLDFPVVYASALEGWAMLDAERAGDRHEAAVRGHPEYVPMRDEDADGPLQLQICSLDYSSYVGQLGIGRITRGRIRPSQEVVVMNGPRTAPQGQGQPGADLQGLERSAGRVRPKRATSCW